MLGDDFLSGLELPTLPCLVGGLRPQVASIGRMERLHLLPNEPLMMGLAPDTTMHQIRILTEVGVCVCVCVCTCVCVCVSLS